MTSQTKHDTISLRKQFGHTRAQQGRHLIHESTRCNIHRFWPECEVTLYADRLELTSAMLTPRTIPMEQIERMSSGRFLGHRHLVIDFSRECDLNQLRIQSSCPREWYEALAERGVPTEDEFNFRHSRQIAHKLLSGLGIVSWLIGFVFFAALIFVVVFGAK